MGLLSLPPLDFIETAHGAAWVECGAGTGLWVRILREAGIDIIGIDPAPRGPNVAEGNHLDLERYQNRNLLIVWPPDGADLSEWMRFHDNAAVCGQFDRFKCPDWPIRHKWTIPGGEKGYSEIRWLERRRAGALFDRLKAAI